MRRKEGGQKTKRRSQNQHIHTSSSFAHKKTGIQTHSFSFLNGERDDLGTRAYKEHVLGGVGLAKGGAGGALDGGQLGDVALGADLDDRVLEVCGHEGVAGLVEGKVVAGGAAKDLHHAAGLALVVDGDLVEGLLANVGEEERVVDVLHAVDAEPDRLSRGQRLVVGDDGRDLTRADGDPVDHAGQRVADQEGVVVPAPGQTVEHAGALDGGHGAGRHRLAGRGVAQVDLVDAVAAGDVGTAADDVPNIVANLDHAAGLVDVGAERGDQKAGAPVRHVDREDLPVVQTADQEVAVGTDTDALDGATDEGNLGGSLVVLTGDERAGGSQGGKADEEVGEAHLDVEVRT